MSVFNICAQLYEEPRRSSRRSRMRTMKMPPTRKIVCAIAAMLGIRVDKSELDEALNAEFQSCPRRFGKVWASAQ